MPRSLRTLALTCLGLIASTAAYASGPAAVTTINCSGNDGSTLKQNVYAYTLSFGQIGTWYMTVYLPVSQLEPLLMEKYFGSGYTSCTFSGALKPVTANDPTIVDLTVSGIGRGAGVEADDVSGQGQQYVALTLSYNFLGINTAAVRPIGKESTPEEKAKALADFKARGLVLPH